MSVVAASCARPALDKLTIMFLTSFPAGPRRANCSVFAPDGTPAVIIDPGAGTTHPFLPSSFLG